MLCVWFILTTYLPRDVLIYIMEEYIPQIFASPSCPLCETEATQSGSGYYRVFSCPECSHSWSSAV